MRHGWCAAMAMAMCVALALPGWAERPSSVEAVELHVMVLDEDDQDWITLSNTGHCASVTGRLRIDFNGSNGSVVIDTAYGGGGTRDPAPVQVLSGPAVLLPVADGARAIDMVITDLPPQGQVIVTLDIDNERGWFEETRVMATPQHIAGSVAEFTPRDPGSVPVRGVFSDGRRAVLSATGPCDEGASEPESSPLA